MGQKQVPKEFKRSWITKLAAEDKTAAEISDAIAERTGKIVMESEIYKIAIEFNIALRSGLKKIGTHKVTQAPPADKRMYMSGVHSSSVASSGKGIGRVSLSRTLW